MTPPRVRSRSSQWLRTALSNIRQYSMARRMISALTTGDAVVGEGDRPAFDQAADLGQFLPLPSLGDGADGKDIGVAGALGLEIDELRRRLAVEGRLGVGHARHRGNAAGQGRRRAGGDGLVFFAARLAQMDVHVDQARDRRSCPWRRWCDRPAPPAAARRRECGRRGSTGRRTWSRSWAGSMTRPLVMRRVFMGENCMG